MGIWAIRELGAEKSELGIAFLVGAALAGVSGYLGGHLSDRFGRRLLILVGSAGAAVYWLGFLAVDGSVTSGLIYLTCSGMIGALGGSVTQAMVADLVPPERHETAYASVRVASNLGVTLGPPVGSLFLFVGGWTALFVGVAILSGVSFALALRYLPRRGEFAPEGPSERGSFALIRRIPVVLLVIFLFVIGEMLWVPTSQSVVAGLAPAEARGAYMGAFGSSAAIGFALAPFVGLNIADAYGDSTMWAFFALVSLVAAATGVVAARGVRDSAASEGLEAKPAVT